MQPNPKIVFIVVCSLSLALFAGMLATYLLIIQNADAALIAIISGHTGTALGGLLSILSRTGATPEQPTEVVTPPGEPLQTIDAKPPVKKTTKS